MFKLGKASTIRTSNNYSLSSEFHEISRYSALTSAVVVVVVDAGRRDRAVPISNDVVRRVSGV
jgi:hypothetical protein